VEEIKACHAPFERAGRASVGLIAGRCLPWDSSSIRPNPWAQTPFERRKPACLLGQKWQQSCFRCTGLAFFEERETRASLRLWLSPLLSTWAPSTVFKVFSIVGL
jgi:hypothetical protein